MIRVLSIVPLVVLALSGMIRPARAVETTGAEVEVRELETKFEQAVIQGDVKFFEAVLAQDFTHTTQSGVFRDREQWLANHKPGQSNYDALNVDQLKIRVYGDSAIVIGRISPQGRNAQGNPIEGQYRYLRVWVRREKVWQVVAFQSTRIVTAEKGAAP